MCFFKKKNILIFNQTVKAFCGSGCLPTLKLTSLGNGKIFYLPPSSIRDVHVFF